MSSPGVPVCKRRPHVHHPYGCAVNRLTADEDEQARFLVLLPLRPAGSRWAPAHLDVTGLKQKKKRDAADAEGEREACIDLLPRARRAHHQNGIRRPRSGLAFSITGVLPLVIPPTRATFSCLTAANNVRLPLTSPEPRTTTPRGGDAAGQWSRTKLLPRIRSRTDAKHMQQAGAEPGPARCAT
jgi:hypothetical protein